ncbi:MAG: DUF6882 domain-containing protein [Myxococcota bacterium]
MAWWSDWFTRTPAPTPAPAPRPAPTPLRAASPAPVAAPVNRSRAEVARMVVDQLVALHGIGFRRLVVHTEDDRGRLRVRATDVVPDPEARDYRYTCDRPVATALLGMAIEALRDAGTDEGRPPWDGQELEVTRDGARIQVTPGSDPIRLDPRNLIVSEALLATIDGYAATLEANQDALRARVAGQPFGWDRAAGTVQFGERRLRARLLGSWSKPNTSWCWSWANRSYAPELVAEVRTSATAAAAEGLVAFAVGGFPCDEGFAWSVAMAAAARLDAPHLYRHDLPDKGIQLFFALLDHAGR